MPTLGFACAWDRPPEPTWSYTPWQLRAALRRLAAEPDGGQSAPFAVADVDLSYPPSVALALKAANARRRDGHWVSMWKHSRAARLFVERRLRGHPALSGCDVLLEIGDLARVPDVPYMVLQDLSYDVLLELSARAAEVPHFPSLSRSAIRRLRDRQLEVYAGAHRVLAMSSWLAEHLTRVSGVPADRIRVVRPGASAVGPDADSVKAGVRRLSAPRLKLLSVGKDFLTKGGEQVVAALALLREQVDPEITLTVAGPRTWPLPGEPPPGVRFLGRVPLEDMPRLYDEHDLFVLPSRMEGFGIVFVEALARGLPCVGRRAFAMPEIITPGRNGALIDSDDPQVLADHVAGALADDDLVRYADADAGTVAAEYSWDRAARQVADLCREPAAGG